MNIFKDTSKILVSSSARITPYTAAELRLLGYEIKSETATQLETEGTMADAMKMNISLRTAHRVLFFLAEFKVKDPGELYRKFYDIPWEEYISSHGYFSISSYVEHPSINDSRYPNVKAKDAIADRFRDKEGRRPDSGSERKGVMIYFYWVNDICSVYFDTSGVTLSKRNYRKMPFTAPMQESLAAAAILATGWKGDSNFINPMCGSGTLAIEAALIALNKVPGLLRINYAFMHIKGYDEAIWKKVRHEVLAVKIKDPSIRIIATDFDPEAIASARQNAKTAGVDHLIEFSLCDFKETNIPTGGGIIILNPAYGERMGEEKELQPVYSEIGDFFKQKCAGYTGYIFTGNLTLAKSIGLKPSRKILFYNGKIDCRLLEFPLFEGSRRKTSSGVQDVQTGEYDENHHE